MTDQTPLLEDLTQEPWCWILADSPQWRAWKRFEAKGRRRWTFRFKDPKGRGHLDREGSPYTGPKGDGIGCDVPRPWPPDYNPSPAELAWQPSHKPARPAPGGISDYLRDGGKLPGPGQHQGLHDDPMPGPDGRDVMPKRQITDLERRMLDWYRDTTHTTWAGGVRCTPYMRAFLDHMAKQIKDGSPF